MTGMCLLAVALRMGSRITICAKYYCLAARLVNEVPQPAECKEGIDFLDCNPA